MKGQKFGGRPPKRGTTRNVTVQLTADEARKFKMAEGMADLPGGHGTFVAMLVDQFLEANGVTIKPRSKEVSGPGPDDEQEGHTT